MSDRVCVDAQFVFKLPETVTSEVGGKRVRNVPFVKESVLRD